MELTFLLLTTGPSSRLERLCAGRFLSVSDFDTLYGRRFERNKKWERSRTSAFLKLKMMTICDASRGALTTTLLIGLPLSVSIASHQRLNVLRDDRQRRSIALLL